MATVPYTNGHNGHANGHKTSRGILERIPPQNLVAEMGVLGGLLLDNAQIPEVASFLTADDFYRASHSVIYQAILRLHDQEKRVDGLLLSDELQRQGQLQAIGGDEVLSEILEAVPHAANTLHYAQIVRQKAVTRRLVELGHELQQDGYSQTFTAEEIRDKAERIIAEIGGAQVRQAEDELVDVRPWPVPPEAPAWHGVAGEIVDMLGPHTESDPVAILVQFLTAFGNLIGRHVNWMVEGTRHALNLHTCMTGPSASGKKGTSYNQVEAVVRGLDPTWMRDGISGGLASGEGLIEAVRDPVIIRQRVPGDPKLGGGGMQELVIDEGVEDKRLLLLEDEFSSVLAVMRRDGNTLSEILRKAWDGRMLRTRSRKSPLKSTGHHISIIAHITPHELREMLAMKEMSNGFANRWLWVCVRRSKVLPDGGQAHRIDWTHVHRRLRMAMDFASSDSHFTQGLTLVRDDAAKAIWHEVYPRLTASRPGLLGDIVSRGHAQVMRLAALYAVLGCSCFVREQHLRAGLALWDYCDRSAAFIFGDSIADPDAAALLKALQDAGDAGLTLTVIRRKVFKNHPRATERMTAAMSKLIRSGLAEEKSRAHPHDPRIWIRTKNG